MERMQVSNTLLKLLPESLHTNACVAGSYAVHGAQPNDIDVWVTGIPEKLFEKYTKLIRGHLIEEGYLHEGAPLDSSDDYESSEVDDSHQFKIVFSNYIDDVEMDVHIILSSAVNLTALLEEFDISVHQAGFMLLNPETVIVGSGFTAVTEQPRILSLTRPKATRDRVLRIFPRYGFSVTPGDAARLAVALEKPVTTIVTSMAGEKHVIHGPLFLDEMDLTSSQYADEVPF